MRTKSVVAVALALVFAALPAAAKPDATREVTVEYQGPNTLADDDDMFVSHIGPMARPKPGERFVDVVVEDASGRAVMGELHQGDRALTGRFCGRPEGPVKLRGRAPLTVRLYAGPGCAEPSAPTRGTITFSFLKR
jgi:hypothetical protein